MLPSFVASTLSVDFPLSLEMSKLAFGFSLSSSETFSEEKSRETNALAAFWIDFSAALSVFRAVMSFLNLKK